MRKLLWVGGALIGLGFVLDVVVLFMGNRDGHDWALAALFFLRRGSRSLLRTPPALPGEDVRTVSRAQSSAPRHVTIRSPRIEASRLSSPAFHRHFNQMSQLP
jgi:hypothetical protein